MLKAILKSKRVWLLAVICITVAATVGVKHTTGASADPSTEAVFEPFANYVAPTGPEISLDAVRQRALQEVKEAQDEDPISVSVSTGSLQAALEVMHPQSMPTSAEETASTGGEALLASTVYLVEMRGDFTLTNARVPPGQSSPHGSVLELLLDAHTGELEGRFVGPEAQAPLQNLGPVAQLGS